MNRRAFLLATLGLPAAAAGARQPKPQWTGFDPSSGDTVAATVCRIERDGKLKMLEVWSVHPDGVYCNGKLTSYPLIPFVEMSREDFKARWPK